jgi:hypothetical protein
MIGVAPEALSLNDAPADTPETSTGDNDDWSGVVSVVVPVYDEAAHIDELLAAIHASPVKKEILLVDDASTDGTREKLQAMPLANDVTVIFHERNSGKGRPSVPRSITPVANMFSSRTPASNTTPRITPRSCARSSKAAPT